MTWDDFERMLCFAVIRAASCRLLPHPLPLFLEELCRQFEGRWITGRHYEPRSIEHLPADHPLRRCFNELG